MDSAQRCDAAYKHKTLMACYEALEAAGFTRYRKDFVDWPSRDGFNCWVGLNTDLQAQYVQINPFVGVHVVPIMKLYTELEGRKYRRNIATYAVHMGLLFPNEPVFRFNREADVAAEAARLARLYSTAGWHYAQSIASYEKLLPLLQERVDTLGGYPERVVACLFLMGRKDEAISFAQDFLDKHRDYFEGFAVPFLKKLAN